MRKSTNIDTDCNGEKRKRPTYFQKYNAIMKRAYKEVGPHRAMILLVFLQHGDHDDVAYCTAKYIGKTLGINHRNCQERIYELTSLGWLKTISAGGGRRSARRQVWIPRPGTPPQPRAKALRKVCAATVAPHVVSDTPDSCQNICAVTVAHTVGTECVSSAKPSGSAIVFRVRESRRVEVAVA